MRGEDSMRIWNLLCAFVLSALMVPETAKAGDNIGVRQITAPSKERGITLDVTVWYPAQPGGEAVLLGDSAFFLGTPAMRDAPIADGKFPLILLSHGAGLAGNPQAVSWIAAPLAKQGFIVAAPAHPGNSGATRSAAETMKLWLRPVDLTETLNAMKMEPLFKEHARHDQVGVLGLSMGGNTALAIAGARINPKLLADYCNTDLLNSSLCAWVRQSGVDLHALDMKRAGRDNRDARVRFAMAIDPAPVDVFEVGSFSSISIPVSLINLGSPEKLPLTVRAFEAAKVIRLARYTVIGDASHYSMFGPCKPGAVELAEAEEIGDPICMDGGGRPRSEIHAELIQTTIAAFSNALQTTR